jgi:predicted metal-dependent hydrolase
MDETSGARGGARASAITIRRMTFAFPADLDPVVVPGRPEESFALVGLSLLLPYLEPYLIRTMKAALREVKDQALRADIEAFNGQEGQHYRQHKRFNDAVRLAGFPALAGLEEELDADYRRFSQTKSLAWNLAYAEGFEAHTTALARFGLESGQLDRLRPEVRELFQWHLVEELEHRTVAFDAYQHCHRWYPFRLVVGLYAQWHLNRFVLRAARVLRDTDRSAFRAAWGGRREAWARLRPLLGQIVRLLWPKLLASYTPWYTPHRIALPERARVLLEGYTARATAS